MKCTVKQASHWHDKRFTPWPQFGVPMREELPEDAWGYGSGEIVRAMSRQEFWNVHKFFSEVLRLVTTKLSCHFREHVNYEQTRRNYWAARRANACRDVNILKFSQRPDTDYPHLSRISTHIVTSYFFIGTPYTSPWLRATDLDMYFVSNHSLQLFN